MFRTPRDDSTRQLLPGDQIIYHYDPVTGQLASIDGPGSTTLTLGYDGALPTIETWTGPVAGSVSRTYDNDFRVATQSVNSANTVSFGYDPDSLLTASGALAVTRYSDTGLVHTTTLGDVADTRTYDDFGELDTYTATSSGATVLADTYTRDGSGGSPRRRRRFRA